MTTNTKSPTERGRLTYGNAVREYRDFLDRYHQTLERFRCENQRFKDLLTERNFFHRVFPPEQNGQPVNDGSPPTLQIWFPTAPLRMGRRAPDGQMATEGGASLVYSIAVNGVIAVQIYPFSGNTGRPHEKGIIIRFGYMTSWQLQQGMERDLKDWITYAHVTMTDGEATLGEKLRIAWLRYNRRLINDEGTAESPLVFGKVRDLGSAALRGSVSAIFKLATPPIAVLVGGWVAAWYAGWT